MSVAAPATVRTVSALPAALWLCLVGQAVLPGVDGSTSRLTRPREAPDTKASTGGLCQIKPPLDPLNPQIQPIGPAIERDQILLDIGHADLDVGQVVGNAVQFGVYIDA